MNFPDMLNEKSQELQRAQNFYKGKLALLFLPDAVRAGKRKNLSGLVQDFLRGCSYENTVLCYKNAVSADDFFAMEKKRDPEYWRCLVAKYLENQEQGTELEPNS